MNMKEAIEKVGKDMTKFLSEKNDAYGNSVQDPLMVFSKLPAGQRMGVRMDDKLSRIARGKNTEKVPEDTKKDLFGYLWLDAAIELREKTNNPIASIKR